MLGKLFLPNKNNLSSRFIILAFICLMLLVMAIHFTINNKNIVSYEQSIKPYLILCLGDPLSFVGGNYSYPRQLERILNTQIKGRIFHVIHKSVEGASPSDLKDQINTLVRNFKPDMIVFVIRDLTDESLLKKDDRGLNHTAALLEKLSFYRRKASPWGRMIKKWENRDVIQAGWHFNRGSASLACIDARDDLNNYWKNLQFDKVMKIASIGMDIEQGWGYMRIKNCRPVVLESSMILKEIKEAISQMYLTPYILSDAQCSFLAELNFNAGSLWKAEEFYKKATELEPKNIDYNLDLSYFYFQVGNTRQQIQYADLAYKLLSQKIRASQDPDLFLRLAECRLLLKDFKGAAGALEQVFKINPELSSLYIHSSKSGKLKLNEYRDVFMYLLHKVKKVVMLHQSQVNTCKIMISHPSGVLLECPSLETKSIQRESPGGYLFCCPKNYLHQGIIHKNKLLAGNLAKFILKGFFY